MRKILKTGLIISMMLCMLVGCGNGNVASNNKDITKKTATTDTINVEDIDWDVDERIIDGRKCLSFNYTNNTKYTITEIQLKMVQKENSDVNRTREVFADYVAFADFSDDMIKGFYILCKNENNIESGKNAENGRCDIQNSWWAQDIKQFEYLEPGEMTIKYIDDEEEKGVTYDYKTKTYMKHINK